MIGKLKKGSSFGGCIRYVTGKDEAKIIVSDGVLLGTYSVKVTGKCKLAVGKLKFSVASVA